MANVLGRKMGEGKEGKVVPKQFCFLKQTCVAFLCCVQTLRSEETEF